jgi:hypothetical protein
MTKRLTAKIGTYEKDGQTKGRYANLGVILSNDNGEYMLMDPTVSLAGILALQNAMAAATGGQMRDRVMVSVFADDNQQRGQQQSGGQSQGGYGGGQQGGGRIDDEINF